MAYCSECGSEINEGAKYCSVCGGKLGVNTKQINVVKTMTCPQCGGLINSFAGRCQACGVEFWGLKGSESINEFSEKLAMATSAEHKISLITTFPIPNTKEDIVEYMILASSNIGYSEKEEFEDAWVTKFIQGYKKANLVFGCDADFEKVQRLFDETMVRLDNIADRKRVKRITTFAVRNLGAVIGSTIAVIAVCMDVSGYNSSLMELLSVILLIVSACTLKRRIAEYIEYGIAVISGLLLIVLAFLLDNGSMYELGGAVVLIISAVNFFKKMGDYNRK